jgi:hypothetical protein
MVNPYARSMIHVSIMLPSSGLGYMLLGVMRCGSA